MDSALCGAALAHRTLLRMPELVDILDNDSSSASSFMKCFEMVRRSAKLPDMLNIDTHPLIQTARLSGGKAHEMFKAVDSVMYGTCLVDKFRSYDAARKSKCKDKRNQKKLRQEHNTQPLAGIELSEYTRRLAMIQHIRCLDNAAAFSLPSGLLRGMMSMSEAMSASPPLASGVSDSLLEVDTGNTRPCSHTPLTIISVAQPTCMT